MRIETATDREVLDFGYIGIGIGIGEDFFLAIAACPVLQKKELRQFA